MIDSDRFHSQLEESPLRPEIAGLQFAIWAHAAIVIPQYADMSDGFYRQARLCVESLEANETKSFFTISALQTLILIAFYEIRQTLFTRAWVSVSRVNWLARTLGLERMDCNDRFPGSSQVKAALPATSDGAELSERRKTFWVSWRLNCFSNVSFSWDLGMRFDHAGVSRFRSMPCASPSAVRLVCTSRRFTLTAQFTDGSFGYFRSLLIFRPRKPSTTTTGPSSSRLAKQFASLFQG